MSGSLNDRLRCNNSLLLFERKKKCNNDIGKVGSLYVIFMRSEKII